MSLHTLFHPEVFQGRKKKRAYFEGWYFKMAKDDDVVAIIPGISLGNEVSKRHAFIQVFSSKGQKSWYITYPYEAFSADTKELDIHIGENHFTKGFITLHIDRDELKLSGKILHHGIHPYPSTLTSPGIMGWYAYVPFMECFHGVVSMRHTLEGSITINSEEIPLTGGDGYIEKDWGTSFPSAWIWMQSNCFPSKNISCMLSVAEIPFLGRTFTGFLGFVLIGEQLYRFGTYTGAKITKLESTEDFASICIKDNRYMITFKAELGPTAHLTAPRQGKMDRSIHESIKGTIEITIVRLHDNHTIFSDTGKLAGIELSEANLKTIR